MTLRDLFRVLLVDEDAATRRMLRRVLERHETFRIVGEAASGAEGLALAAGLRPDVAIVGVETRGMSAVTATAWIKRICPSVEIVGFGASHDEDARAEMLDAGAAGYAVKGRPPREIISVLHDVSRRSL